MLRQPANTLQAARRERRVEAFISRRRLRMCFLSGDYAEALAAADKAKPILWASTIWVQFLDYSYYTALTLAALYPSATADEQNRWRELLTAHREQLREWAENFRRRSPTSMRWFARK